VISKGNISNIRYHGIPFEVNHLSYVKICGTSDPQSKLPTTCGRSGPGPFFVRLASPNSYSRDGTLPYLSQTNARPLTVQRLARERKYLLTESQVRRDE